MSGRHWLTRRPGCPPVASILRENRVRRFTMRVLAVVFVSLVAAVSGGFSVGGPPSLVVACGNADAFPAQSLWLTTSDHVRLYAIEAGTGSTTVVLAHLGWSDLCDELPYAKTFLAHFFFQAEDGIRDGRVTGVQKCALPIWLPAHQRLPAAGRRGRSSGDRQSAGGAA